MDPRQSQSCTAFAGVERVASGSPREVVLKLKALMDAGDARLLSVFDDTTAEPVEFDWRGDVPQVLERLSGHASANVTGGHETASVPRSPGRPKLGVVGREVTLLPRHWEWLGTQPGSASVALRKLVEHAMRLSRDSDQIRLSQETTFRFMSAMAGNEAGFEEAVRALYARDRSRFEQHTETWPPDVRTYAFGLAADSLSCGCAETGVESGKVTM